MDQTIAAGVSDAIEDLVGKVSDEVSRIVAAATLAVERAERDRRSKEDSPFIRAANKRAAEVEEVLRQLILAGISFEGAPTPSRLGVVRLNMTLDGWNRLCALQKSEQS